MRTTPITRSILTLAPALAMTLAMTPVATALAAIPDLSNCHAELPAGPLPRFLMMVPDGSGPPLTEARIEGGAVVSAVISLWLIDGLGNPVANFPAEDIWLADACGGVSFCGLANPDGPTDVNGLTTFTGPYPGGGNMPAGCVVEVVVAGSPLWEPGLELRFNSPDITGDRHVNLSDVTIFTQAIASYDWAADFNVDGVVNLTDITLMAQAVGSGCP